MAKRTIFDMFNAEQTGERDNPRRKKKQEDENYEDDRKAFEGDFANAPKNTYGIDQQGKRGYNNTRSGYNASRRRTPSRLSMMLSKGNGSK